MAEMFEDHESDGIEYRYLIKRLGHQEMGSRENRLDKSHRGRYFLIPKMAVDFFPHLSDCQLNDQAFICLTPIFLNTDGTSRSRCYYEYVYHNSKVVNSDPRGRNEHRIYLSLNFDDGMAFKDDIIVMRQRTWSELLKHDDEVEMTEVERSFDESSSLKAGFDYFIDWIRKDQNPKEWAVYDRIISKLSNGGRNVSSVQVKTNISFFETKVKRTVSNAVEIDERIVSTFSQKKREEIEGEKSATMSSSETVLNDSAETLGDRNLTKYASLFNSVSFRDFVMTTYGNNCAVTGQGISYGPFNNLEAAHINPKCHGGYYLPQNGIAMRRDIRWAFDKGMFYVDPETLVIHVHEAVRKSYLGLYDGKRIEPVVENFAPHPQYLEYHKQKIYGSFLHTGALNKLI